MTDSQWDSVVWLSSFAAAVDSDGDPPLSCRSVSAGARIGKGRAGARTLVGGQVVPLLNMGRWIGTNRANANPASFAAAVCTTCAACVTCANQMMRPSRYGTAASGTMRLTALASPLTSPSRTVTGTGGVSLKR